VSVFRRWHADPDVHPFVLCQGDSLLGYGEVWIDPAEREVELARIIVAPPHRGRGVGRELVHLLLKRAASSGFRDAFVRVFPDNTAAIACYLGAGFSMVSTTEQQQYNAGQPVDYLWMRTPVPNS